MSRPDRRTATQCAPAPQVYKSPLMQQRKSGSGGAAPVEEAKFDWSKADQDREEALKTIKDSSRYSFRRRLCSRYQEYGWRRNTGAGAIWRTGREIPVAIYAILPAWLRWGRSRTAAVVF